MDKTLILEIIKQANLSADQTSDILMKLFEQGQTVTGASEVSPFEIGKQYFIRTVTYHLVGKLTAIKGKFLIFDKASWIADTGRFYDAMHGGIDKQDNAEIEPWGDNVFINMSSIVDGCEYTYSLPEAQK